MSDSDQMAGYVSCYTCGTPNSVLVNMEIRGTKFDGFLLTVIGECPCGKGWPATTTAFAENEQGVQTPEDREWLERRRLEREA